MSDRFSQYPPMIPTFNNNPNMLQQQQQPTQQQQGQQGQQQQQQQPQQQPQQPQQQGQQGHSQHQPQQDGHPNYPDQSRMWQPQIQYRPRSGMDISPPGQQQTPQVGFFSFLTFPPLFPRGFPWDSFALVIPFSTRCSEHVSMLRTSSWVSRIHPSPSSPLP